MHLVFLVEAARQLKLLECVPDGDLPLQEQSTRDPAVIDHLDFEQEVLVLDEVLVHAPHASHRAYLQLYYLLFVHRVN